MRQEQLPSLVTVALGVWMMASPFVLGYGHLPYAMGNAVVAGALITLLALSRVLRATGEWASWAIAAVGFWLLMAPTALGYEEALSAVSNDRGVGVFALGLGVWSALVQRPKRQPRPTEFASAEPSEEELRRRDEGRD
jgi:SPW repeat